MNAVAPETADIPALDWQGQPLVCRTCAVPASTARCERGHACVHDRYARRIDRFFRWNPAEGNAWLHHPYFEVRAIACRHADVFHLHQLIDDEDETVRLSVALRLPLNQVSRLRRDPHREVRIRVAMRLEGLALLPMADDEDYFVRTQVARRLPLALLPRMLRDPDREVRLEVARRLAPADLLPLCHDRELAVRREVAQRLPAALLGQMLADPAWEVRWELARRAGADLLEHLAREDSEEDVRAAARERLAELKQKGACHE